MQHYHLGENRVQPYARFEHAKAGDGSGAGYERWRSTEHRPHTPTAGREDVYVAHHRLLAVVECYSLDEPIESVLDDLAEKDVHHCNGVKWDNRPENIEPVEHARHASITQEQVRAWAEDEKRERRRRAAGVSDDDVCDGCGEPAEPLATSPGFAGERCLECAKQESDGEPIEV
ncbi:HNH endonuclease [Halorubrum salinum]|uniref:HNH endonuclease n=1 Tax=Halorubrum salinum TaxID=767517 RepID=UPI0021128299|nr:HNH endonuclease [Halorubrum salinum]